MVTLGMKTQLSVLTLNDVPVFVVLDGAELFPVARHPARSEQTLLSGSLKAKPFGCGLRPQP